MRQHLELRGERQTTERQGSWRVRMFEEGGPFGHSPAGTRQAPPPTFEEDALPTHLGPPVKQPRCDQDLVVGLRKLKSEAVEVRDDIRQRPCDQRLSGGRCFQVGKTEPFLNRSEEQAFAGGNQLGDGRLLGFAASQQA